MTELGVLADDLTGGMMVASLLEREGVRCPLVTSAEALNGLLPEVEAVVVARKIRLIEAGAAQAEARQVWAALEALGTKRMYYKYCATFDSTEKGNIGPITEALMDATGQAQTIVCPAFPEYTVTIFQGRMFLGSTPLGESFKRFDPATPMTNSNLVEVLQAQTTVKVGLLSHGLLCGGADAVRAELKRRADTGMFIVDAVDDSDLTRIAELVVDWTLTTGADGMPGFLAKAWRAKTVVNAQEPRTLLGASPGFEAVIAGSCAGATLQQLEHFELTHPIYRIDLIKASDDQGTVQDILNWARTRLDTGPIAVATSADVAGIKRAQDKLGRAGAAELADRILGEVASGLFELGVRKFVVAGGETSGQVINSLGVEQVEVSAFDELGGGYCHQSSPTPMSFVLKAGALGAPDFFFRALERMQTAEAAH